MTRLLTWLDRGILWPIWVFCLLLILLLFTLPGLKFSVFLAEKALPSLQVKSLSGSWLTGATLSGIQWQDDNLQLELQQLDLRIQKRCLIQFRICIPELALQQLSVQYSEPVTPTTQTETIAETSAASFSTGIAFPIPLRIDQLRVDQLEFQSAALQLRWQTLQLAINAWGNRLHLSQGLWQDVVVTLPEDTREPQPLTGYSPIALPAIQLPVTVFVEQFQLNGFVLQQGAVENQLDSLQFSSQMTPRQIRILDLQLAHSQFNLQLTGNIDLLQAYPLTATAAMELKAGELAGQQLQVQLFGDLNRLQAEMQGRGPIDFALAALAAPLTDDLPLTINLGIEELAWPLQQPEYRLGQTNLSVHGSLSELQLQLQTEFNSAAIPDSSLSLTGSWQHWQQQLNLQSLRLSNAAAALELSGNVVLADTASWQLALQLHQLQPEHIWPEFPGQLQGNLMLQGELNNATGLQLELAALDLQGELRQLPLHLQGQMLLAASPDWQQWQFKTPGLQLGHGSNQLHLEGELSEQWQLLAQLTLPDLSHSYPGVAGQIEGELAISGAAATPELAGHLTAQQLTYQGVRLGSAEIALTLDSARNFASSLHIQLRDGRWQQYQLQSAQLQFNGDLAQHLLTLKLEADELNLDLTANGQLLAPEQWRGRIEQVELETILGSWRLDAPLDLAVDTKQAELQISAHCWQQQRAQLCLTAPALVKQDRLQFNLALTDYALHHLNALLPYNSSLAGNASAEVALAWQAGQAPELKLAVQGPQGAFTQQLDVPVTLDWRDLQLNADIAAHQLRLALTTKLADSGDVQVQVLLSDLDQPEKPLRAELRLTDLTLDFLKPLLDEYSELAGNLSSQLSVDGSLSAPELTGELRLDGLKVRGKLAPTDIDQADLLIKFQGERAELAGLILTPEGRIELLGMANWQDLNAWQTDLAISGDPIRVQIPQAELFLQPDLTVTAKPDYAKVTGSIFVPRGKISVDSLPQNAIGLSDDLILLDEQLQPLLEANQRLFNLETDIRLRLGQQVRLQAFGLRTRLGGELRIQQQQFNPNIRGEVTLQDGTFRAYGQDLLIRQGKLTFNGPADQPFLNVEAIRNPVNMEDDVIAGIRVSGPADEPVVVIFSEPAKPQANALSYLIMGRDLDSESGFNANSVTTSLIAMSISSSGRLVGEIGEAFGVSDLMLDTEGAGDNSQVTVSGYLTRDLQLKYGIGIFQPIGQFTLRYRLLRNLYIEAVSGLDKAVDLLYKFEFD